MVTAVTSHHTYHPSDGSMKTKILHEITAVEPTLLVQPPGWAREDELWNDLVDVIMQEWEATQSEIMKKTFSLKTWIDDFIELGFHSTVLADVARVLRISEEQFGLDVVELVLSYERVGHIAELVLSGEVSHFSTEVVRTTTDGARNEGGKRPSEFNYDHQGSTESLPAGNQHLPSDDTNRKQQDDDGAKDDPEKFQPSSSTTPSSTYPQFLHNLNLLAAEKGIELVFTNANIMDDGSVFPQFVAWSETIPQTTTPVYHGSTILLDALEDFLSSFITDRVHTNRIDRRGYYCVTRATYWTNSAQYARVWPVIKSKLRGWRDLPELPSPNTLIVVSEPVTDDVTGASGIYTSAVIPQDDTEMAREVPPSSSASLTCEQYVNATQSEKNKARVAVPRIPLINTSDFIIAPLPRHTISSMERGNQLNRITPINATSILTCATTRAVSYLNSRITKIIVLGWGEGRMGATNNVEFGTAGIKIGTSGYWVS